MKSSHGNQLKNEVLAIISTVIDDRNALQKIHTFLKDEIYQEQKEEQIPDKYKNIVSNIADSLIAGLICFFNPDTLEVEEIPENMIVDPEEFELITGETYESAGLKHENWKNCVTIELFESHDSFKIMEYFVDEINDDFLRKQLIPDLSLEINPNGGH